MIKESVKNQQFKVPKITRQSTDYIIEEPILYNFNKCLKEIRNLKNTKLDKSLTSYRKIEK